MARMILRADDDDDNETQAANLGDILATKPVD
jgi:hypothetical protein